ncbi:MAG: M56 family metallopeptidase [Bryobacteraceae bacterium]|nr:M56 family metallopeptidase [Bryobacteraceae bacterium]
MEDLLLNAVVRQIWTALAQSVIYGVVLAVAVRLLIAFVLPPLSASTRYAVWFVTLLGVSVMPFVFLGRSAATLPAAPRMAAPVSVAAAAAVPDVPSAPAPVVPASAATPMRLFVVPLGDEGPVFLFLGCFISALLMLRLGFSYLRVRRLKKNVIEAPPEAMARFAVWREQIPTARPVRLLVSRRACSPMAVGFLKPAILMPESLLLRLTVEEFDHLGLHELAHIRRGDDWTNLAERLIQAVYFFHPAVHWICAELEFQRELACDDQVVAVSGAAKPYARSLAKVLELAPWRSGPVLASGAVFRKRQIFQRIETLFDGARNSVPRVSGMTVAVVALCIFGALSEVVRMPEFLAFGAGLAGNHSKMRWSSDGKTVEFESVGEVHFSMTEPVIEAISPNGWARVRESGWTRREMEFSADGPGGAVQTKYLVDGRQVPWDARGREWSAATLAWVIRESGSNAEERALAIHDKKGVAGFLNELDRVQSDHVRRRYLAAVIDGARLVGEDLRRVVSRAGKLGSDHDKAELLLAVMDKATVEEGRVAYFDAVKTIQSDHDKRRVLTRVVAEREDDVALLTLVSKAAIGISSDHDKAELLRTPALLNGAAKPEATALRTEYLQAAGSIAGSHDKARVLKALAELGAGKPEVMQEIVRAARTIDSDHDRGQVLNNVIAQDPPKDGVAAELLVSAEKISSDNEKANVLLKLAGGPHSPEFFRAVRSIHSDDEKERVLRGVLSNDGFQVESVKSLLDVAGTISSDHSKASVLKEVAKRFAEDPGVRADIRRAAEKISSDAEYRGVVSKLLVKE